MNLAISLMLSQKNIKLQPIQYINILGCNLITSGDKLQVLVYSESHTTLVHFEVCEGFVSSCCCLVWHTVVSCSTLSDTSSISLGSGKVLLKVGEELTAAEKVLVNVGGRTVASVTGRDTIPPLLLSLLSSTTKVGRVAEDLSKDVLVDSGYEEALISSVVPRLSFPLVQVRVLLDSSLLSLSEK